MGPEKAAFFSVLVFGLLTHIHIFSVNYIFHDSVTLDNLGYTYSSGRWALGFLDDAARRTLGAYQLPFINGFISIGLIAITVLILIRTLKVKSVVTAAFIGMMLVSFPSVASHFAFMFTAPPYFLSMLMATLAVYLINERCSTLRFASAVALTTFSIGIYQAYLSFSISLALAIVIIDGLRNEKEFIGLIKKGLVFVSMLIIGLILYLSINKLIISAKGIELTAYQGLNKIGRIDFALLPKAIYQCYYDQLKPSWLGIITSLFERKVSFIVIILGSAVFLRLVWLSKAKMETRLLLIFLAVISPLALNSVYLMSPGSMNGVHSLMRMSLCFTYILPVLYVEILCEKAGRHKGICVDRLLAAVLSIVLAVVPPMYCYRNNTAYLNAELAEEQAEAYLASMVTRIRSTEGYRDELPVAYIGFGIKDQSFDRLPTYGKIYTYILSFSLEDMLNTDLWQEFCAIHLGWDPAEVEDTDYYCGLEQVQQMPCYPDDGSICVIDGAVVVKFSN